MMKLWGALAGILLYLEIVYHLGCFGFTACNPVFALTLVITVSAVQALVIGAVPKKGKKAVFWILQALQFVLFAAQLVYLSIFRQPLQWEAAVRGGGDALTNYWREALDGILNASPFLLLMALPMIAAGLLFHFKKWMLPVFHSIEMLRTMLVAGVGVILSVMVILIGKYIDADYYEDYQEFFDPLTVAENMGVLTMVQRDTAVSIGEIFQGAWDSLTARSQDSVPNQENMSGETLSATQIHPSNDADEKVGNGGTGETASSGETEVPVEAQKPLDTSPNELPIDFGILKAGADSKETTWLAEYMEGETPTKRNEYTGIFEGYNLIYLTAEGFSPYAVREDLTPTLYRMIHSGFVFNNYYVPLWQTSTSDGEYINCTGLIPDGQFSMRKSGSNDMAFTLPRFFEKEGVSSLAYHNNSLSYYDRYVTHNNLGYTFKAARLGDLPEEEWGSFIFPMEHPDAWPASDLEMMQGTVPEYINEERFNIYYMTVSGHMNYNFKGNAMSGKNKEAVAGLDMSENARAYIACHIELDKALEYLLQQLEAAGKLENTVICMSADHYPYGMSQEEYEELAGKPLSENLSLYRNNLILWNAGMEEQPVEVEKVCGSMDIVPTLLNLFGFDYDSRLYAGKDIFSDDEGMVIFNDRSFITDTVIYNRKAKSTVWKADQPQADVSGSDMPKAVVHGVPAEGEDVAVVEGRPQAADTEEARNQYMDEMKQEVKDRYQFSAYILQKDYYKNIREALGEG